MDRLVGQGGLPSQVFTKKRILRNRVDQVEFCNTPDQSKRFQGFPDMLGIVVGGKHISQFFQPIPVAKSNQ